MQNMYFNLIIFLMVCNCLGQETSIRNIIQKRADLRYLSSYMQSIDLWSSLGNPNIKGNTFFATYNTYFTNLPRAEIYSLNGTMPNILETYFAYHLVGVLWSPEDLGQKEMTKLTTKHSSSYLFVNKIEDKVFVNNAEIVTKNLEALNGRCHIIDKFFVDARYGLEVTKGLNAHDYLEQSGSDMFLTFKQYDENVKTGSMVPDKKYGSAVGSYTNNPDAFCTLFVPNNEVVHRYRAKYEDDLARIQWMDPNLMKNVVDSMVIPNKAYHISILKYTTDIGKHVDAIKGYIKVYELNNQDYVMNECGKARITKKNIKSNNCIIHFIDDFLGLPRNTTYWTLMFDPSMSEFATVLPQLHDIKHILNPIVGPEKPLSDEQKYTIFAPTEEAFKFHSLSKGNPEKLRNELKMLIVKGVINIDRIEGTMRFPTLREGYDLTIWRKNQNVMVEVDYVRGMLVDSNICTLSGVIHKVNKVIGTPFSLIINYLQEIEHKDLLNILEATGYETPVSNPTFQGTFFIINKTGVKNLPTVFREQQNKKRLQDLIARHVGKYALYLSSIPPSSSVQFATFNGDITVSNKDGRYYIEADGKKVEVEDWDMRMRNGVVHVVKDFLPHKISSSTMKFSFFSSFIFITIFFQFLL